MAGMAALPSVSSDGGLSRYLTEIRKFPFLEASDEASFARRWRDHGDREAAYHLVTSHLWLAAKIAMKYRGYGLPIADLVSEANLGLMQAVKRFEPERGFRLATYAMWWIRASVQEYILRSWSLVKLGTTAAQKKLFFNLRKLKNRLSAFEDGDLHPDQVSYISEHLQVSPSEVIEMNGRLRGDASLNISICDDDTSQEWQDRLADPSPNSETLLADADDYERRRAALSEALKVLSARERAILEARMLTDEPKTLDDLAREHRVSRERIRQIEQRAFERLKVAVHTKVGNSLPPPARKRDERDAKPSSASQRALEISCG
ncbi:RNA polymerase sigma factor RpoH [Bradyrhizobium japonicum]|uniref:RNA polymerase sigma factor RpoH n=1 Tax=Bradyrhizobium japonicum TaxID=375 RepID=UPI001BA90F50|nr:RNA polymerase sigma factor RpoH [Bradyrhizobium japonicum]MBR0733204.1 RNA polymerase sigma factor RpoH [Bradyrhizobium japonicum]